MAANPTKATAQGYLQIAESLLATQRDHVMTKPDFPGSDTVLALIEAMEYMSLTMLRLSEEIAEVRDGLDAWAGRVQVLENLPGTEESSK